MPNRLTLLVVEKPGVPVMSMTLLVKRGKASELPEKRGIASVTVHLLTAGTSQHLGDQIDERITSLGGPFDAEVSFDYTTIGWAVLKEDLPAALEMLADIVQHPTFPQEAFEREWKAVMAARQAETKETSGALLLRYFFGTGPYGFPLPAEMPSLERTTREDIVRFHHQAYRPEETILAVVGDLTSGKIESLAKKYFGTWSVAEKPEWVLSPLSIRREPAALVINRSLVQASLGLAFVGAPTTSPDTPALLLLSHLLAGHAEGRLGQNLRERRMWVYNVRSVVETFQQTGLFLIDMSVPYEVVLPALEETVHEISRMQTVLVPEGELAQAKQDLIARLSFKAEDIRDLSHFLAVHEFSTQGQEPPGHALIALRSVTAAEVQRVADKYLDPQQAVVTVVGDAQALGKYAPMLAQGKLPQWNAQRRE